MDDDSRGFRIVRPGKGSPAGGTPFVRIKRDSTARSGKRYTGNILSDGGAVGQAVQFIVMNDPGTDDLLLADEHVLAINCPSQYVGLPDWLTTSPARPKYMAVSICPWGALA